MADLVPFGPEVQPVYSADNVDSFPKIGIAGETLAELIPVYVDSLTNRLLKCDALVDAHAEVIGITVGSAYAGQPIPYMSEGDLRPGCPIHVGQTYVVSFTAGKICPLVDLSPIDGAFERVNDLVSYCFYATEEDNVRLMIHPTGTRFTQAETAYTGVGGCTISNMTCSGSASFVELMSQLITASDTFATPAGIVGALTFEGVGNSGIANGYGGGGGAYAKKIIASPSGNYTVVIPSLASPSAVTVTGTGCALQIASAEDQSGGLATNCNDYNTAFNGGNGGNDGASFGGGGGGAGGSTGAGAVGVDGDTTGDGGAAGSGVWVDGVSHSGAGGDGIDPPQNGFIYGGGPGGIRGGGGATQAAGVILATWYE